ncbi:DUF4157 domain-containing protein [Streptomyces sp. NPDC056061]|uniref:eCIS core domain-containing protein n=1 Tax=Streptomyces sp. NPDC056061 TaxID=3345700 RepID=UPI0035D7022C
MRTHERQDDVVRPTPVGHAQVPTNGPAVGVGPVAGYGGTRTAARPDVPGPPTAHPLGALQRSLGKAAAVRGLETQRRAWEGTGGEGSPAPGRRSSVPDVLRSAGKPLGGAVRADMEARLGADFSDVRLHTGAAAQRSAAEAGARAYTSASHVVISAPTRRHARDE